MAVSSVRRGILCNYIGITHVFSCINICRSLESCLNTRPLGQVFKHRSRDAASVTGTCNAMKQTCVIVILAYLPEFSINRAENVA